MYVDSGPMNADSMGVCTYILTFTDDYARYVTVYFMKQKSEVNEKFQEYVNMVENLAGLHEGQMLLTDNGGEYISDDLSKYCSKKGIMNQYSNPYTQSRMVFPSD